MNDVSKDAITAGIRAIAERNARVEANQLLAKGKSALTFGESRVVVEVISFGTLTNYPDKKGKP